MLIDTIEPVKTAMIVVDMQNDFVASGAPIEVSAARAMVPKLAEALKICRDAGIRVIYTAHVHRRDGCDMGLFDDLHSVVANREALQTHLADGLENPLAGIYFANVYEAQKYSAASKCAAGLGTEKHHPPHLLHSLLTNVKIA
jgi:biuret amidohydrolase